MALSSAYFRNIPKQLDFVQAEGSSAIARVFKKTRPKSQSPKKRNKKGLEKKRGGQARVPISSMMPSACPNNRNICFFYEQTSFLFKRQKAEVHRCPL
jgi:hypothetical protein